MKAMWKDQELPFNQKFDKKDYHVKEYAGGVYGICKKADPLSCVFGGTFWDEYSRKKNIVEKVYEAWDGTVVYASLEGEYIISVDGILNGK
jgi:hypothetical protein